MGHGKKCWISISDSFIAFFLPDLHTTIDWERGIEMLYKEFQQLLPPRETEEGERRFRHYIRHYEEERTVTYTTSYEEYVREELRARGIEKGIQKGQESIVLRRLERK